MSSTLYYVLDPMCSWCWAFAPLWKKVKAALPPTVSSTIMLGGLAPDTEHAMPAQMQRDLQATWHRIAETVPGTRFNHEFWQRCQPRRSTYPACRAVLAARAQNPAFEEAMIEAIQSAYYLNAENPSDKSTLLRLSGAIGCDTDQFSAQLESAEIQSALMQNIQFARRLGVRGFPSLILLNDNELRHISIDYSSATSLLDQIAQPASD